MHDDIERHGRILRAQHPICAWRQPAALGVARPNNQEELTMKFLLLAVLITPLAGIGTPAQAQNYPWCAFYNAGDNAQNCGFVTVEQCRATVHGIGGFCGPNNTYVPPPGPHAQSTQRPWSHS
jgi:hypothetical protein